MHSPSLRHFVLKDPLFPNYEEYMTDTSAIPIKAIRAITELASHGKLTSIRYPMFGDD